MLRTTLTLSIFAAAASAAHGAGETITVTATGDDVDFGGAQQIGDLPGPDGEVSFREGVIAANNTPGPQTIAFNIPAGDANFDGTTFRIKYGAGVFITDDGLTIDGFTQTAFTGDTNPTGPEISFFGQLPISLSSPGIYIDSDGNTVRGLGGFNLFQYGIEINGNNNVIEGVKIVQSGSAAVHIHGDDNLLDGSASSIRNRFSSNGIGVWVRSTGSGNVIIGNLIQNNHSDGVNLEGDDNTVGGPDPAHRNVINMNGHHSGEFDPVGAQVCMDGDANTVQGNYLGVSEDGLADQSGSAKTGVQIEGANNLVGGDQPGSGNVISGHGPANVSTRYGVLVHGGASNAVVGNLIGVGADGVTPIPNERGVAVDVFRFDNVPQDALIADNTVAHAEHDGILIAGFGSADPMGCTMARNVVYANGDLAIDLGDEGVTANDPGDADMGENRLQNFPVLTAAEAAGSTITVEGTLDSIGDEMFTIEVFAAAECDPSGHGEAEAFLGAVDVLTDAGGDAAFAAVLGWNGRGQVISATATRHATGDTSELSACIDVVPEPGGPSADLNDDGQVSSPDLNILLGDFGCTGGNCPGDVDADGDTDSEDLNALLAAFGDASR